MSNASSVETLFFAALEKGTAAERAAYLDSACGGDAELRRQVEKLLKAHPRVGDFLKKPVGEQLAAAPKQSDATQEFDASTDVQGAVPAGRTGLFLARTEGEGSGDDHHSDLDFLQPSTRPDSLGRLGHYEVLQVLGEGGFGIVFRAFDEQLQRVVAIKVLAPQMATTSPARKRFLREARSSAKVRHENVVQVYAVEEQPLPYLVMELVPGETLQERLDRTGPLEMTEVVHIGRQIAEGLAAAHDMGLIHRDIKPANILIEAGPNQHVKITDFGLARAADDASLSQSGVVAGTPMFMAPEQASGDPLDHRADLFSLGSVLYTICSGRPPFRAKSTLAVLKRVAEDTPRPIPEIIPEAPQWLCDIIARLHAKKPDDRFATAREVADLLGRGLAALQHPESAKPPQVAGPATMEKVPPSQEIPEAAPARGRPRFRSRRWAAAAAVLLTLLGGFGITEATGVTNVRGTVIRLFSPEGTLVVEVDDPEVSVKIDGSDIVITGAGAKEIRLKPGNYTVEGIKDGKTVRRELVTVTKNDRQLVRVSQENGVVTQTKDPDRRAAEYVLSIGGTVWVNGGTVWENEPGQQIKSAADLPRESFRLTGVPLGGNKQVTDAGLAVLRDCKNLTLLQLIDTPLTDAGLAHLKNCGDLWLQFTPLFTDAGLAHLKNCKGLWQLHLVGLPQVTAAGLAHLKDCENLTALNLDSTPVTDAGLAHLKDCKKLTGLELHNNERITDAGLVHLKDCKNLKGVNLRNTKVTAAGIDDLKKNLPQCRIEWDGGVIEPTGAIAPFTDADAQRIAALPAAEQVEEVRTELLRRNPDFDGKLTPTIKGGVVTVLTIQGWVADLSPLKGMKLTKLWIMNTSRVADLTPLRGMPLETLCVWPFKGSDLTPLQGMPLKWLNCGGGRQKLDLTPLAKLPLEFLCVNLTQVSDLTPLKDMPLTALMCSDTPVSDFTLLHGMHLKLLHFNRTKVSDLSPLKGTPLAEVECQGAGVTDLSPLVELPLTTLKCDFQPERDAKVLRAIKTLQTINDKPAAQFWKEVDDK